MATQPSLEQVQSMYIAYYGRPADPVGLAWWAQRLDENGGNLDAIVDAFGNSAEYRDRFGGLDDAQMIDRFYQQVFNRGADPEGLAFYLGELAAGRMTLASIAKNIWDGAINLDALLVQDKLVAADYYTDRVSEENKVYGANEIPGAVAALGSVTHEGGLVPVLEQIDALVAAMTGKGPAAVSFSAATWVAEGQEAVLTVRVGDHVKPVEIPWRTEALAAAAGADFVPQQGALFLDVAQDSAEIRIATLLDGLAEGSEAFRILFDPPVNGDLPDGVAAARTIEILDQTALAAEPTPHEQLMLELINRARLDPAGEALRVGIDDVNEGLFPGTLSSDPRQPVAFDPDLSVAARTHGQWLLDVDRFTHTGMGGSNPGERIDAAGYDWRTYGENLAWQGTTGAIDDLTAWVEDLHEALFADLTVVGRGHRLNYLDEDFREVGLGVLEGAFTSNGTEYDALMIANDYATRQNDLEILTGVIFDDLDGNGFYTPGEGRGGVRIDAQGPGGVYTTWSMAAGGYQMELPPGAYEVLYLTPEGQDWIADVTLEGYNEKVDWIL